MEESLQDKWMLQEKKPLTVFLNSHSSTVSTGKKNPDSVYVHKADEEPTRSSHTESSCGKGKIMYVNRAAGPGSGLS